jgi:DNA-binding PadR family transcriptional regulator
VPEQPDHRADRRGRAPSAGVLDLALLGLLADGPMHGYQIRVRLTEILGPVRSYSYGSLYPALRRLERDGFLAVQQPLDDPDDVPLSPRRSRVTYRITARGKERLAELLSDAGPQSSTDEGFGVHLALFPRTAVETRLRILQGRRQRLEQRREGLRASLSRTAQRVDDYTAQLHRLAIQAHDREVVWLADLIVWEGSRPADPEQR